MAEFHSAATEPIGRSRGPFFHRRSQAVEQNPEGSVELRQADLGSWPALKDFQLVTKCDDLNLQVCSPSEAGNEAVEKGTKDCVHALYAMACNCETLGFLRRMEFMGGTALTTEGSQRSWPYAYA